MRDILALDPSSKFIGWVFDDKNFGTLKLKSPEFDARMKELRRGVIALLHQYWPEVVAVECPIHVENPDTTWKLGRVFGNIEAYCIDFGVPELIVVNPTQAKVALTGNPRASKDEMQAYAQLVLGNCNEHEADAYGVRMSAEGILKEREWRYGL